MVSVIKDLFVDRYGVSTPAAQVFLAVNLPGALLAVPLLSLLRRRVAPYKLLAVASMADALLLLCMWCDIGFGPTLALRAAEGVTDVVVFALLFDGVRRTSGHSWGVGLGAASTALTLGLATGVIVGGITARDAGATFVFPVAALACVIVAVVALWRRGAVIASESAAPCAMTRKAPRMRVHIPSMWPPLAMTFVDRSTGGVMTAVLPVVLGSYLGYSSAQRGWLIGLPLGLMALGATPAGWLVDQVGAFRVRLGGGLAYAGAMACIPLASEDSLGLAVLLTVVGVSGAALLASSLVLVAGCSAGSAAMGGFRAAGDMGYFAGLGLAAALAASLGGADPGIANYASVIVIFAVAHFATNIVALLGVSRAAAQNEIAAQPVS